ncbi:hypothetical protein NW762_005260 [Fusarium torreyae]|uniref:Short-chain dehydrogenase/reductase n=1 Tax=Fusarium torreyae TaxID=1237075 RepID=A0A9W8S389_9HYPO|nr:hypothetical protein NW762_005260 [Fusarium torreyae]
MSTFDGIYPERQGLLARLFPPKPLSSRVPKLRGKVAIVTGSACGLSLETSRKLLSYGLSKLILTIPPNADAEEVGDILQVEFPKANIEAWHLDMESYASVREFGHHADLLLDQLDIVILNDHMAPKHFDVLPGIGHEKGFQVNYFSTLLLGVLLLPLLKERSSNGEPGRLTIVGPEYSSETWGVPYKKGSLLDYIQAQSQWHSPFRRYRNSTSFTRRFATEVAKSVSSDEVIINSVSPGPVKNTALLETCGSFRTAYYKLRLALIEEPLSVEASRIIDAVTVTGQGLNGKYLRCGRVYEFFSTDESWYFDTLLWEETMKEFSYVVGEKTMQNIGLPRKISN